MKKTQRIVESFEGHSRKTSRKLNESSEANVSRERFAEMGKELEKMALVIGRLSSELEENDEYSGDMYDASETLDNLVMMFKPDSYDYYLELVDYDG